MTWHSVSRLNGVFVSVLPNTAAAVLACASSIIRLVEPTDDDIEHWFYQHRSTIGDVTIGDIALVAYWLPIVGPPANDRASLPVPCHEGTSA